MSQTAIILPIEKPQPISIEEKLLLDLLAEIIADEIINLDKIKTL